MRFLVLAALLLRLLPATGEAHCGRASEHSAVGAAHAHHDDAADCDHCPPEDCGQQVVCATSFALDAVVVAPGLAAQPEAEVVGIAPDLAVTSPDNRPPVPPPQFLLT